jgi:acyl-homoserine-lactone acylase
MGGALRTAHQPVAVAAVSVAFACALLPACTPVRERVRSLFRSPAERLAELVTIRRDEWGIAHIAGATDAAALFGLGYAQAEDDWAGIEEATIRALGRAAEAYGPSHLADDLVKAAFEVERLARAEYEREPPERRRLWDAYALGVETFLATHPDVLRRLTRFEPWYIFTRTRHVSTATVIDGVRLGAASWQEVAGPGVEGSAADAGFAAADPAGSERARAGGGAGVLEGGPEPGSAAWAIAPGRTAAGHALLATIRRAPFADAERPYEFELRSDEGWHVAGLTLPGLPVARSGSNERLGWAHTASTADVADAWTVTFDAADPAAYRYDGATRPVVTWLDTIRVRVDTALVARVFRFRRTHHGPVVTMRDGRSFALAIARFEEGGALQQWLAMSRAAGLDAFLGALGHTALPGASTVYADAAGNILYAHGGAVPRRTAALDRTAPADGADANADWNGTHRLDELPRVLNPPDGVVHAAGVAPLDVTAEGDVLRAEAAYMVGSGLPAAAPAAHALLAAGTDWTLEKLAGVAFDTRVAVADTTIAALVYEWERLGAVDPDRTMIVDAAIDSLRQWDRVATVASVPMTHYVLWQERRARQVAADDEWPRIRALEDALAELGGAWGRTDVAWGDLNRLQRPPADTFDADAASLPIAGAPPIAGTVFEFRTVPGPAGKLRFGVAGNAWIGVVEFGPRVQARAVDVFGHAAAARAPHSFDQAPLYARGALRTAWFHEDDVVAAARRSYRPGAAPADSVR